MAVVKCTNSKGTVGGILDYVTDKRKTLEHLISGVNCSPQSAHDEMMTTKRMFGKTEGRQYVHIVQSFSPEDNLTHEQAHEIGLKLAEYFSGFQAVVATHTNTEHKHNHIVLNTVNFETGKKFHQTAKELELFKEFSNRLCQQYGLSVTPVKNPVKTIGQGEYEAALKGESWKFRLINAIEDALARSPDKASFIANMEYEGYSVNWSPNRKYITYTTEDGWKCRDNKLHHELYLKENLEKLFAYRAEHGFTPMRPEPRGGWISQIESAPATPSSISAVPVNHSQGEPSLLPSLLAEAVQLGRNIEGMADTPPPVTHAPARLDSKLKRRQRIKQLALGHKLSDDEQEQYFKQQT